MFKFVEKNENKKEWAEFLALFVFII